MVKDSMKARDRSLEFVKFRSCCWKQGGGFRALGSRVFSVRVKGFKVLGLRS